MTLRDTFPSWWRRHVWVRRIVYIMSAAIALYAIVGFFILPPVARSVLRSRLSEALHRDVTIREVWFNPFTLSAGVYGLSVADLPSPANATRRSSTAVNASNANTTGNASVNATIADVPGNGTILTLDALELNAGITTALYRFAAVLTELNVVNPVLRLRIEPDGSTNFTDLIGAGGPSEAEASGASGAASPGNATSNGTVVSANATAGNASQPANATQELADQALSIFRFVLSNFAVANGTIIVNDRLHGTRHLVEELNVDVPFASSLPTFAERPSRPAASAVVNGTPISLDGVAYPFAPLPRAEFTIALTGTDLAYYNAYVPLPPPLALTRGSFSCRLDFIFEQQQGELFPATYLRGGLSMDDVLVTASGHPLLGFANASVGVERFSLREGALLLSNATLSGPFAALTRTPSGSIDALDYFRPLLSGPENATRPENRADESRFRLRMNNATVQNGRLSFTDKAVPGGFATEVRNIDLALEHFALTGPNATSFDFGCEVKDGPRITAHGRFVAQPLSADGQAAFSGLALQTFAPYLRQALPELAATGRLEGAAAFRAAEVSGNDTLGYGLENIQITLRDLGLSRAEAAQPLVTLPRLTVTGGSLDGNARRVQIGSVKAEGGSARLIRQKDGSLDAAAAFAPASVPETPEPAGPEAPAWSLRVVEAGLSDFNVTFIDQTGPAPVSVTLSDMTITARGITPELQEPVPFTLAATVGQGGRAEFTGQAKLPLEMTANGTLRDVDLTPYTGFLPPQLNAVLRSGKATMAGRVRLAGQEPLTGGFEGFAALDDVVLVDARNNRNLLSLGRGMLTNATVEIEPLAVRAGGVLLRQAVLDDASNNDEVVIVRGLDVRNGAYAAEGGDITADSVAISGFEANLMLREKSGLNVLAAVDRLASAGKSDKGAKEAPADRGNEPEPPEKPSPQIRVARVAYDEGTMRFWDYTVKPTFFLELSGLSGNGSIAPKNGKSQADLRLKGYLDRQALLDVRAVSNLDLDEGKSTLSVSLHNMDMTSLTPYTLKYIAYPVERGRLGTESSLALDSGDLSGQNKIVLRHFEVGEQHDRPDAANVPLKLGLALLDSGDGTVRLDIPLSGSLNDPNFDLGNIIARAVAGVFAKIVTAPFSILGAIFSGSEEEPNIIEFLPGTSDLGQKALAKVDTLAQALKERPALVVSLTGQASTIYDRDALVESRLKEQLRRAKYSALRKRGHAPDSPDQVIVGPDEYPEYLEDVWRDAPVKKERGFLGIIRKQPLDVMEADLKAYLAASDEDLLGLGRLRAEAVSKALQERGVAPGRIRILQSQLVSGPDDIYGVVMGISLR